MTSDRLQLDIVCILISKPFPTLLPPVTFLSCCLRSGGRTRTTLYTRPTTAYVSYFATLKHLFPFVVVRKWTYVKIHIGFKGGPYFLKIQGRSRICIRSKGSWSICNFNMLSNKNHDFKSCRFNCTNKQILNMLSNKSRSAIS